MSRPALLFDLDGTLIDTDPIHAAVFVDLMAEYGRQIDVAYYVEHLHGRLNADIFGELLPTEDPAAMGDEKEARFRARLGAESDPMPGLTALMDRARGAGWAMAVVTNAPRDNAEAMLRAIGMEDAFDALVIGGECARGKPNPDPYLAAMDRLGAAPRQALAFEDSRSGIAAAAAAGLDVVGVRSTLGDAALRAAGATLTVADFTDPALAPHLDRLEGAAA